MKLALFLLFLTSAIYANEIQRIESIVEDISNLRSSYEKCKKDLNFGIVITKSHKNKCNNYSLDIKDNNNKLLLLKEKNIELQDKIVKSQNIIKKQKNLLKTKEKTIFNLENRDNSDNSIVINRYIKLLKTKENEINSLKNKINSSKNTIKPICTETNKFPTLIMKKEYQITIKQKSKSLKTNHYFLSNTASTYRLLKDSSIYGSINGNIVDSWEKHTSFTSNKESLHWIKITGFFVNKKWKKAMRDLWVKKSDIIKR